MLLFLVTLFLDNFCFFYLNWLDIGGSWSFGHSNVFLQLEHILRFISCQLVSSAPHNGHFIKC